MHFNELPMKALFCEVDGSTVGPKSFSGSIGKSLEGCENLGVTNFKRIFTDDMPILPPEIVRDLSSDQKYLYELIDAIQSGIFTDSLAKRKPGPLNHARFLTLACRILRLYVATQNPSKELQILAQFIIRCYGPMWFKIKQKPELFEAPRHLFQFIKSIEWLPKNVKNVVQSSINRNCFYAHPENLLLSMLVDEQYDVRKKAVDIILKARSESSDSQNTPVRKFKLPNINYDAKVYYDLVDWQNIIVNEPPLSKTLTESRLSDCVLYKNNEIRKTIEGIPSHTQAVERAIKLVTETSSHVSGECARNGEIYSKIAVKNLLKKTDTKSDYIEFMNKNLFE